MKKSIHMKKSSIQKKNRITVKERMGCIWRDVIQNFFGRRLLVFCVFQFTILHYYGASVKQYAIAAGYPAAPWILPFMGQNVYFQFVYGISTVYFYSNVPFMQRCEMYGLMRQGRVRWASAKLLRIWISAAMLAMATFLLSILPLMPHLEWTAQWGKLYHSLALTDAGALHQVRLSFSYDLIQGNNALTTALTLFAVLCIATGLTGTALFTISLWAGRAAALLAGTLFAVLSVVFGNLYLWQAWISFLSPFSWMDLLLLRGKVCSPAPTLATVCIAAAALMAVFYILSLKAVQTKDLNWIEED